MRERFFYLEGSTISVPGMRAGWGTSSGTLRVPGESAPNLKSSDSQLPPPPTADLNDKPLTKLNKPLTKLNKPLTKLNKA